MTSAIYDDGSSTESEYYEDANDEELAWDPSAADQANDQAQHVAAVPLDSYVNARSGRNSSTSSRSDCASDSQQQTLKRAKNSIQEKEFHAAIVRSTAIPHDELETTLSRSPSSRIHSQSPSGDTIRHTIPDTESQNGGKRSASCDHCCASIVAASHTTAFERAKRLCHCCKTAMGTINRNVVHISNALLKLRFCAACFDKNGRTFMAEVGAFKPPQYMKCSGCHRSKDRNSFHVRQRIFRHWEEPLDENHYCLECLPSGFASREDKIIPHQITCVKCSSLKHRNAFSQALKDHATSCEDLKQFEQSIKDSLIVCNKCLNLKQLADRCLLCSKCKRLLERFKFSKTQQQIAREEDENPDHMRSKPVYVCCNYSTDESRERCHREPAKRKREDDYPRASSNYTHRIRERGYSRDHIPRTLEGLRPRACPGARRAKRSRGQDDDRTEFQFDKSRRVDFRRDSHRRSKVLGFHKHRTSTIVMIMGASTDT